MKTPFKLKSGNASAFKNLGSSPAKQTTLEEKALQSKIAKEFKLPVSKKSTMPKNWNTKGSSGAGKNIVSKVDVARAAKVKTQNFRDAANKIKTVSSKTNIGSKVVDTKAKTKMLKQVPRAKTKMLKQVVKKIKPSRAIPVIGEALMTYDVLKEGVKRVATKSPKLQLPEAKATKFSGGKTLSEAKKRGKSNIWNKKK